MSARRWYARVALFFVVVSLGATAYAAVQRFPRGLALGGCLLVIVAALWQAATRHGAVRYLLAAVAFAALVASAVIGIGEGNLLIDAVLVACMAIALGAARQAFLTVADLPSAERPKRAVLFYNPKSGGGKATRFALADEAKARGVEARELKLGDDLRELVEQAIDDGADALAMAGGDGSQAIVAAAAAAHSLPYACIPAGTRNHFALDLGVDRDDVVGALDALVDGRERVVDLAEVNGRVFVNNVSLGLYAEAVQKAGYRDAKIRTILATAPDFLDESNPDSEDGSLQWSGPGGERGSRAAVLMVSNDRYRLGRPLGSGTRPRLDAGVLGIAAITTAGRGGMTEWSAPSFQVDADGPVAAGIDGEALRLDPPLVFRSRPNVLRVRIAPQHPGASPSAAMPGDAWGAVRYVARLAFGRD